MRRLMFLILFLAVVAGWLWAQNRGFIGAPDRGSDSEHAVLTTSKPPQPAPQPAPRIAQGAQPVTSAQPDANPVARKTAPPRPANAATNPTAGSTAATEAELAVTAILPGTATAAPPASAGSVNAPADTGTNAAGTATPATTAGDVADEIRLGMQNGNVTVQEMTVIISRSAIPDLQKATLKRLVQTTADHPDLLIPALDQVIAVIQ